MISSISILPIISASISGAISAFHLLLFLRKPGIPIYKKFSIAALFVVFYGIASCGYYGANNIEAAINWRRIQATALSLFTIFYLDFIIDYIHYREKLFFRIIQIAAMICIIFQFTITNTLTWSGEEGLFSYISSFNQIYRFYDISPGILSQFMYAVGVISFLYVFFITYKQRKQISGHKQTLIIISVSVLFLGFLNDTLISMNLINSLYLLSTSLLITIALSTYSLLDTILEDAQLKDKLESANLKLELLTNQLEQRVQDRTIELQDQAEFFQSLINNNPVAIAILDNEEKIIQTNTMFKDIFGYSLNETIGKELDRLITSDDDYLRASKLTRKVMNNEKVITSDVRKRKNGELVNVEILGVPVIVKGKKVGGLGMYQDITERLRSEKLLIDSESRYRSLFFDSPIPLIEENYQFAKETLTALEQQGIRNIEAYLIEHKEIIHEILKKIKTININRAAISLYQLKNKKEIENKLVNVIPESSYPIIARELSAFYIGSTNFTSEIDVLDLKANTIHAILHVTIAPGYEESWEKVFVSMLDNTKRKLNEKYLEYLSTHDQLTGLANRTLLFERLKFAIRHAQRNKTFIAVFFIDLDGFKRINDIYGHRIGDQLLSLAAKRLKNSLRDSDTIARVGGDEFVLILENFKEQEIIPMVADKILQIISKPYYIEEHTCLITTSIGISLYPGHSDDPEELISIADTAMYQSKQLGKNQFYLSH